MHVNMMKFERNIWPAFGNKASPGHEDGVSTVSKSILHDQKKNWREKQTFVSKLSMVASLLCGSQNRTVGGQGEADPLHVYGAGFAQKGYLFKCQVYKRVSITLRKSVFVVCKRT